MDAERFVKGFDRDPLDYNSQSQPEWQRTANSLMAPSDRWARYFARLVDSHLTESPLDSDDIEQSLDVYTSHTHTQLLNNVSESMRRIVFHHPELDRSLTSLNFHTITQELTPYWLRLVDPEQHPSPDYIDITVIQARLAVKSLHHVSLRQQFRNQLLLESPGPTQDELALDAVLAGQITEIDAGIAILEVLKDLPSDERESLAFVASPVGYESGIPDKASDFLLFDTVAKQAHGLQVKTKLTKMNSSKYDQRYVSLIDGYHDLGNWQDRRLTDGRKVRHASPGILSADFILQNEALQRDSRYSAIDGLADIYGQIRHAKEFAETMRDIIPFTHRTEKAAAAIGPRILYALHENEHDTEK